MSKVEKLIEEVLRHDSYRTAVPRLIEMLKVLLTHVRCVHRGGSGLGAEYDDAPTCRESRHVSDWCPACLTLQELEAVASDEKPRSLC